MRAGLQENNSSGNVTDNGDRRHVIAVVFVELLILVSVVLLIVVGFVRRWHARRQDSPNVSAGRRTGCVLKLVMCGYEVIAMTVPVGYTLDKLLGDTFWLATYCVMYVLVASLNYPDQVAAYAHLSDADRETQTPAAITVTLSILNSVCWVHSVLMHVLFSYQHYRIWTKPVEVFSWPGLLLVRQSFALNLALIWASSIVGGAALEYFGYWNSVNSKQCVPCFASQSLITFFTYVLPLAVCVWLMVATFRQVKATQLVLTSSADANERRRVFDAPLLKTVAFNVIFALCKLPYNTYLLTTCLTQVKRHYLAQGVLLLFWSYVWLYPFVLFFYKPKKPAASRRRSTMVTD